MDLKQVVEQIDDFRRSQGLRHTKLQMFGMILISNLCGYFGGRAVARFTKIHQEIFMEELSLKHRPPSHVTFSEFINSIDETQMIAAFNSWTSDVIPLSEGDSISGDGKALGSTLKDACGQSQEYQSIVSLFCEESGLVYAMERFNNGKSSEVNVIRFLLTLLSGMGVTIFTDAAHCQKKR